MKLASLGDTCPFCRSSMCCGAMSLHAKATEDRLRSIAGGQCPDCGGAGKHDEFANGRCITCNGTGAWDRALAECRAECERLRAQVATLGAWVIAACNDNHSLMPPAGIEIAHRVGSPDKRTANTRQDAP